MKPTLLNRAALGLLLALACLQANVQSATVTGTLLNPDATPYTNNVLFRSTSTPTAVGSYIVASAPVQAQTTTNGVFLTALAAGRYQVSLLGTPPFWIQVPDSIGTFDITSLTTTGLFSTNSLVAVDDTGLVTFPEDFWETNAAAIAAVLPGGGGGGSGSVTNLNTLTNGAPILGAGAGGLIATNASGGRTALELTASATNSAAWATTSDPATARTGLQLTEGATNTATWATTSDAATARSGLGLTSAATNSAGWATTSDAATARTGLGLTSASTNSAGWATTSDAATARSALGVTAGGGDVVADNTLTNGAFVLGSGTTHLISTNAAGARLALGLDLAAPGSVGTNLLTQTTADGARAAINAAAGYIISAGVQFGTAYFKPVQAGRTGNVATVYTDLPHKMIVGQKLGMSIVIPTDATNTTFNAIGSSFWTVATIPTTTNFTFACTNSDFATASSSNTSWITTWHVLNDTTHIPTHTVSLLTISTNQIIVTWSNPGSNYKLSAATFGTHYQGGGGHLMPFWSGVGLTTANIKWMHTQNANGRVTSDGTNFTYYGDTSGAGFSAPANGIYVTHSSKTFVKDFEVVTTRDAALYPIPTVMNCNPNLMAVPANYGTLSAGYDPSPTLFYMSFIDTNHNLLTMNTNLIDVVWTRTQCVPNNQLDFPTVSPFAWFTIVFTDSTL